MDDRFINRYNSFCSSLEALERAKDRDSSDEFVVSGAIQKFNLTFDISWKVMKDIIVKYHKVQDFATGSPRETLRVAKSVKLIGNDIWMEMLDDRNDLAHDYDGMLASKCFDKILDEYVPVFDDLRIRVSEYIKEDVE